MNIQETKAAVRRQILAKLKGLAPEGRVRASAGARALLEGQAAWQTGAGGEPMTTSLPAPERA